MKTLHDGREVESDSAEWRLECLASYLIGLEFERCCKWLAANPAMEQEMLTRMAAMRRARMAAMRQAADRRTR